MHAGSTPRQRRTLLLVLMVGLLVVPTATPSSGGVALRGNGRIAWYRFDTEIDQIYSVDADGSDRRRMTDSKRANWDPAWSPDGAQIAFVRVARRGGTKLMVMNADGSDLHVVYRAEFIIGPVWSPDGSELAACQEIDLEHQIVVLGADGSDPTTVGPASACDPAWSPDGTLLAFTQFDENFDSDLWVMTTDGSGATQLTFDGKSNWPTWSPDGAKIAFTHDRRGGRDLFVIDSDGTDRTRLTDTVRTEYTPDWSPDGTLILFCRTMSRDPFSFCDLWTIAPDGSSPTRLTQTRRIDEFEPNWQPVP